MPRSRTIVDKSVDYKGKPCGFDVETVDTPNLPF